MEGQIVKIISNDYFVFASNEIFICKCRGKFRKENITPLVGDYVFFDKFNNYIMDIKERKNSLTRPSVANIDQAFIITSLKHPDFSSNLLDKFLTICIINNITPVIILTKKDLVPNNLKQQLNKIISYYKKLGINILYNYQILRIKKCIKNKTTVFTGQTGSGKSTLMNKLDKSLNFETNEISEALGRGKHTTRYVSLVEIYNGKVLDTPGFSDIDVSVYKKEQIRDSFIEFKKYKCNYKDCMHINEKDCCIKEEVNKNNILKSRYENYIKFLK